MVAGDKALVGENEGVRHIASLKLTGDPGLLRVDRLRHVIAGWPAAHRRELVQQDEAGIREIKGIGQAGKSAVENRRTAEVPAHGKGGSLGAGKAQIVDVAGA